MAGVKRWALLAAAGLLLAGCAGKGGRPSLAAVAPAAAAQVAVEAAPQANQPDRFFEPDSFYKGLEEARRLALERGEGALVGGLVPHHALAGSMFSRFFLEVQERPPQTMIVVGPNHEHRGQRIITGRRGWATRFGAVEADRALVDRLVKAGLAVVDEEALSTEHAIGAIMPYLKYHAPQAKVAPLILHRDVTPAELERIADLLLPLLGPDVMLVASVDFSHYLTRAEAEAKDVITLDAIQRFDLGALWRMGPDHLDSPPSLGLLMLAMRKLGATGPEIVGHTNSGVIIGSDLIETTSYFTFKYRKR